MCRVQEKLWDLKETDNVAMSLTLRHNKLWGKNIRRFKADMFVQRYTLFDFMRLCTHNCVFYNARCQMVHTCRRSAKIIAVIWKSKNREWGEMKRTSEGSSSAPRHCFSKLFSSHWEAENNAAHRPSERPVRAAQSALSAHRRKREIKERRRGEEREGCSERCGHQRR